MPQSYLTAAAKRRPVLSLVLCFIIWKSLLLLLLVASPGPGYDTSTLLLYAQNDRAATACLPSRTALLDEPTSVLQKTARWDAVYFLSVAERGYLYEQEWAWGYGFTRLLRLTSEGGHVKSVRNHN